MALTPGTRLGRYEVRSPLGAGGMGEVYLARDTSLQRDVAVKVLPPEFAADPSRLRRFQQEALATAAFNHPHIVGIFDVGTHDGIAYVVTELLDGRTLRDTLTAGALTVRKAVQYASQIAAGLAEAHDKGIVHRDLKPENVFVTADDRVKILDFGIARVLEGSPLAGDETNTAVAGTLPGSVIGTVGYMAPEQVRGERVDHRADIFAFGTLLYEMLTRRRAFKRDTVPQTLSAILSDDLPPWTGETSPLFSRAMRIAQRCVEKSPSARFQSARDLSLVLADEGSDTGAATAAPVRSGSSRRGAIAAGVVTALVAGTWAGWRLGPRGTETRSTVTPVAFQLPAPYDASWSWSPRIAISHDGRTLAAIRQTALDGDRLYTRRIDSLEWRPVPGTEDARDVLFSPNDSQIAFYTAERLFRAAVDGSHPPREVAAHAEIRGADWGDDEHIVFADRNGGLFRVTASGGTPQLLAAPSREAGEVGYRFPIILPGSKAVVHAVFKTDETLRLVARRLDKSAPVVLAEDGLGAQFVDGRLVYANSRGEITVRSFNPVDLTFTSAPRQMPERPAAGINTGDLAFRVSNNGTAVFVPNTLPERDLVMVDHSGKLTVLTDAPGAFENPRVSPNGRRLVLADRRGLYDQDVFIYEIDAKTLTPVTTDRNSRYARWAGDDRIVFSRRTSVSGGEQVWMISIDARGQPLGDPVHLTTDGAGAPTGFYNGTLIYGFAATGESTDLWTMPIDRPSERRRFTPRAGFQYGGSVSTDGRWLAFASDEQKTFDVYVTSFQTPGVFKKVTTGGGTGPTWSSTGNDLFFVRGAGQNGARLWRLPINSAGEAGTPVTVPVPPFAAGAPGLPQFDVLPTGGFVLAVDRPRPLEAQLPVVIVNWLPAAVR